ncbi:MAG TPA: RNA methyltransferase [Ruminococcaceae bacterium]|nr:RNA methyltransferase [Oscillospiraceae bacterium]
MEKITSKNNNLIKDTKKLLTSSSLRYEKQLFVLEGARLCFDVLNCVYKPKTLFFTENIKNKYPDKIASLVEICDEAYEISEEVSQKLSETKTSQGIFLTVAMKENNECVGDKIIALDNVQDPSNVGAIIRSAEALGIDGIIVYGGCDIYNPKAIRATMGSLLRMNIIKSDNLADSIKDFSQKGYSTYATVPTADAFKITDIDFNSKALCVIGNEANGVEDEVKNICDKLITIPMLGRAESLNASVAASITMWEMLR